MTAEVADPAGDALQTIGLLHPEPRPRGTTSPTRRARRASQHRHLVDHEWELVGLDLTDRGPPRATPRSPTGPPEFLAPDDHPHRTLAATITSRNLVREGFRPTSTIAGSPIRSGPRRRRGTRPTTDPRAPSPRTLHAGTGGRRRRHRSRSVRRARAAHAPCDPRRRRLAHDGPSFRVEAGQQHRALCLSAGAGDANSTPRSGPRRPRPARARGSSRSRHPWPAEGRPHAPSDGR